MTREEQLGLDAAVETPWIAAASTADQLTTQECIYNTEQLHYTSAAQRSATDRPKA